MRLFRNDLFCSRISLYVFVAATPKIPEAIEYSSAVTIAEESFTMTGEYIMIVEDAMRPVLIVQCRPIYLFLRIYGSDISEVMRNLDDVKEKTRKQ